MFVYLRQNVKFVFVLLIFARMRRMRFENRRHTKRDVGCYDAPLIEWHAVVQYRVLSRRVFYSELHVYCGRETMVMPCGRMHHPDVVRCSCNSTMAPSGVGVGIFIGAGMSTY